MSRHHTSRGSREAAQLFEEAVTLLRAGERVRAANAATKALELAESCSDDMDLAKCLLLRADIYRDDRCWQEAEIYYYRSLMIIEQASRRSNSDVAKVLQRLALVYEKQHKGEMERPLLERALRIRKKTHGEWHPDVAMSLRGLAGHYTRRFEHPKAGPLLQRALVILERVYGHSDINITGVLGDLAQHMQSIQQPERAGELLARELAIRESSAIKDDTGQVSVLMRIGHLYQQQSEYAKAELHFSRAIAIKDAAEGTHLLSMERYYLALLHRNMGKYLEAGAYWEHRLQVAETARGPHHEELAPLLNEIASVQAMKGQYRQAESTYLRALAISECSMSALGGKEPVSIAPGLALRSSLHGLAFICKRTDRIEEAEQFEARAIRSRSEQ